MFIRPSSSFLTFTIRGGRAYGVGLGVSAHLESGLDEDHSELGLIVEAALDHQLVALFEDVQRQEAAGEEHHVEWEQWYRLLWTGHGSTTLSSFPRRAGIQRWVGPVQVQLARFRVSMLEYGYSGDSSSGRTTDSGSVSRGSNPRSPATTWPTQWRVRLAA